MASNTQQYLAITRNTPQTWHLVNTSVGTLYPKSKAKPSKTELMTIDTFQYRPIPSIPLKLGCCLKGVSELCKRKQKNQTIKMGTHDK